MTESLFYTIPGQPVSKKNSQRICRTRDGRPFIRPSSQYESYERKALFFLRPVPRLPIDVPVCVTCRYFMETRRAVDLTNLMEATHDVLVRAGILSDDNRDIIAAVDGSRVYCDKSRPRVEITITPIDSYPQWKNEKKAAVKPAKRAAAPKKKEKMKE